MLLIYFFWNKCSGDKYLGWCWEGKSYLDSVKSTFNVGSCAEFAQVCHLLRRGTPKLWIRWRLTSGVVDWWWYLWKVFLILFWEVFLPPIFITGRKQPGILPFFLLSIHLPTKNKYYLEGLELRMRSRQIPSKNMVSQVRKKSFIGFQFYLPEILLFWILKTKRKE